MKKVTIRLFQADLDDLRKYYHGKSYNKVLRALVGLHLKLLRQKAAEHQHRLQEADFDNAD